MSVVVTDLVKRYGPVAAVDGVSFTAAAGEVFGLLGTNGAGKTTTLECLLGLRQPDGGTIAVQGVDAVADPRAAKRLLGAQLQQTALQDKITPREAIRFFGRFYDDAVTADELIGRFGLAEKADAAFDTLSVGQRQRLGLALAFVNRPAVLVLDEPTAGLDPHSVRDLHGLIRRARADGRTVVLSTHDIAEAEALCDRVAIVAAGRVVAAGRPADLVAAAAASPAVVVRTTPPLDPVALRADPAVAAVDPADDGWRLATADVTACVVAVARLIGSTGVRLVDLRISRPTLEDVFVGVTGKAS